MKMTPTAAARRAVTSLLSRYSDVAEQREALDALEAQAAYWKQELRRARKPKTEPGKGEP